MSRTAEFTAHGFIFAGLGKLKLRGADRTGKNFDVVTRTDKSQRVDGVRAGDAKMDGHAGGYQNAMGNKKILLRDHAHCDRAIGALFRAQIALDELSCQMQRQRIDFPRILEVAQERKIDLVVARSWNQTKKQRGDEENTQLSPLHRMLSESLTTVRNTHFGPALADYGSISLSTALQRSHTVGYFASSPTRVE